MTEMVEKDSPVKNRLPDFRTVDRNLLFSPGCRKRLTANRSTAVDGFANQRLRVRVDKSAKVENARFIFACCRCQRTGNDIFMDGDFLCLPDVPACCVERGEWILSCRFSACSLQGPCR